MGTNFNYDDVDHQVIFDRINSGSGSGSLQEASRAWQQLSGEIGVTGKSYVHSAIHSMLTCRDGAAAEAASAATGAMLPWMDDVARIAASAAQRTQGQADFWVTARNNIPPVPPAPVSASFLGNPTEWFAQKMDWFPGLTTEEEKAQQRQQDAAEQARQAMRVYQSSSNGNLDPAMAFTAPQSLDGSIGALPLAGSHVAGASTPATIGSGGAGIHQAQLLAAHQPDQSVATVSQQAQGGSATPGNSGPGQGVGNPTPGQGATAGPLPLGAGSAGPDPARRAAVRSTAADAQLAGAGLGRGGGAGSGRRGGAGSGRGGGAGFGPRPSMEFGPRPTGGVHSTGEDMSARGGASSAGSARGAGAGYGAPFAGGTSQRDEQDREHRSKYLVHDDSNAIVGDLPPTAPAVIGEDY